MQEDNGRWRLVDKVEVRLRGRKISRNIFKAYAYGHKTRFADRDRPRGQTGGRWP